MQLILAIDADRQQADQLANLVRKRVPAELIQATDAGEALQALGDRVPDLILTSLLLSPFDDGVLAEYLRELGPAGAHIQTIRIPVLGSPKPTVRSRFSFGRKQRPHAAPDGCDPIVFADEIGAYLARAAEERQAALESLARRETVEPGPLVEDILTYVPAYAPETDAPPSKVDPTEFAWSDLEERTPIYVAPEPARRDNDDREQLQQVQEVTPLYQRVAHVEPAPSAPTYIAHAPSADAVLDRLDFDQQLASSDAIDDVKTVAFTSADTVELIDNAASAPPQLASVPVRPIPGLASGAGETGNDEVPENRIEITDVESLRDLPELHALRGLDISSIAADTTSQMSDAIAADEDLLALNTPPAENPMPFAPPEPDVSPIPLLASRDEPYVLCMDQELALPLEMMAQGVTGIEEPAPPIQEPARVEASFVSRNVPEPAIELALDPPAAEEAAQPAEPLVDPGAATSPTTDASPARRTPAFESALAAIRKAWGKPRGPDGARAVGWKPRRSEPTSITHPAAIPASDLVPTSGSDFAPTSGSDPAPTSGSDLASTRGSDLVPTSGSDLASTRGSDLVPTSVSNLAPTSGSNLVPTRGSNLAPTSGSEVTAGADDIYELSASPALHDLESALAAAGPAPEVREPVAEIDAIDSTAREQPGEDAIPKKATGGKKRPEARRPARPRNPTTGPMQDEWGLFDPNRCGFAAVVDKLKEVTDEDDSKAIKSSVRVVSYR